MTRDCLRKHCEEMCKRFKNVPTSGTYGEHRLVLDLLNQTEWIPVSERLPEKRGMYIVTEKVFSLDDREHTGRFNRMTEQVEFCNGKWQRARFYEVVAWMPLPEPYKEGEGE